MVYTDEQKEQIRRWIHNMPERNHRTYRKAIDGKSLRAAVNANCHDCMNWQIKEVHRCNIVTCPLHPYRPTSKAGKSQE